MLEDRLDAGFETSMQCRFCGEVNSIAGSALTAEIMFQTGIQCSGENSVIARSRDFPSKNTDCDGSLSAANRQHGPRIKRRPDTAVSQKDGSPN